MAKAPKNTDQTKEPTAEVVPAPLAAALEEADPVIQAHITRQANHFTDLAPSLAKKELEDKEREALLLEHEKIAERNRKVREEADAKRKAEEELEGAAAAIEALEAEIPTLEAQLADKKAELARLQKLVKE